MGIGLMGRSCGSVNDATGVKARSEHVTCTFNDVFSEEIPMCRIK